MDTELVTAAARGDEGAFASLALAAGGRLHAVAYRILIFTTTRRVEAPP